MTRRRRASSSVSLSPSSPRAGTATVPQLGLMVRGIVTKFTSYGAFVKVPGYLDGLLHFSRISESPDKKILNESEVKNILRENDSIFSKVVLVGPGRYSLDIRFVDQVEGLDLDPENEQRIALEPEIAQGVWYEPKIGMSKDGNKKDLDLAVNKIFHAVVVKEIKYGVFVKIEPNHVGLLPTGKLAKTVSAKFGDKIWVKIVEIQNNGKFNCDARFVDQRTGADLDPSHEHSSEKITVEGDAFEKKSPETKKKDSNNGRRRDRSESVARRRNNDRKRDRSVSEMSRRNRDRSESVITRRKDARRDRSESVIRRRTDDRRRDRSESVIARRKDAKTDNRKRDRSDSVIARRRDDKTDGRRDRSESVIARRRDDKKRDRSESLIHRRRDRSESVIRRRERSPKRDEEIIIRRR